MAPMTRMSQNFMNVTPEITSLSTLMPHSSSVEKTMTRKMRYKSSITDKRMTQV